MKRYSSSLKITHPELSKEWHYPLNGTLTPNDVTAGSSQKVFWKCSKGEDHIWKSEIKNRAGKGRGCPICSGYKVVASNSLATNNPNLAKEWHPIKNAGLEPKDIYLGSHKKVWWRCTINPEHEWQATVMHRNRLKTGCPYCSGKKISKLNRLSQVVPYSLQIWHPTKNKSITPHDVSFGSSMNAWWICEKDKSHVYQQVINSKFNGGKIRLGCPYCSGAKVNDSNSFASTHPNHSKFWDYEKNKGLTPDDVSYASSKRVWWKCNKGDDHVWQTKVSTMFASKGCPFCSGNKIHKESSIVNSDPEVFKEWFFEKNKGINPYKIGRTSLKKVWWKCEKSDDHIWKSNVNNRTRKDNPRGCPFCTLTPQSRQELTITFELLQFFDINPRGFKTYVDGKLWTIDIYIPSLNLGIEFDGSYWHKDKQALDKLKTQKLNSKGFEIIRIREEPLRKINDKDIISTLPFNGKSITDKILKVIQQNFNINEKLNNEFATYLSKNALQNEHELDKYIDRILNEKANKQKPTTTKPKLH